MTPENRALAIGSVDAIDDTLRSVSAGTVALDTLVLNSIQQHIRALRTVLSMEVQQDDEVRIATDQLVLSVRRLRAMGRSGAYEGAALAEVQQVVFGALEELDAAQARALAHTPLRSQTVPADVAGLRSILSVVEAYIEHENTCEKCRGAHMEDCPDRRVLSTVLYDALPNDLEPFDPASRVALTGQPV